MKYGIAPQYFKEETAGIDTEELWPEELNAGEVEAALHSFLDNGVDLDEEVGTTTILEQEEDTLIAIHEELPDDLFDSFVLPEVVSSLQRSNPRTQRTRGLVVRPGDDVKCGCGQETCVYSSLMEKSNGHKCHGTPQNVCFRYIHNACNVWYCSECSYVRGCGV
jgi:hypothetical protein